MTKVTKFQQQCTAKTMQITKVVAGVVPEFDFVALTSGNHGGRYFAMGVHVFKEGKIIVSVYDWDDSGDNRQKIRDSYDERSQAIEG